MCFGECCLSASRSYNRPACISIEALDDERECNVLFLHLQTVFVPAEAADLKDIMLILISKGRLALRKRLQIDKRDFRGKAFLESCCDAVKLMSSRTYVCTCVEGCTCVR